MLVLGNCWLPSNGVWLPVEEYQLGILIYVSETPSVSLLQGSWLQRVGVWWLVILPHWSGLSYLQGRPLRCLCRAGFPQCPRNNWLKYPCSPGTQENAWVGSVSIHHLRPLRSFTHFRRLEWQGRRAHRKGSRPGLAGATWEQEGPSEACLPHGSLPFCSPVWFPTALTTVLG